jgi:hypothetical protein
MSGAALRIIGAEPTLDELAATANRAHLLAVRSAQDVLDHSRRAGEALLAARSKCKHGEFLRWIHDHCQFGRSSAYSYMDIAKNWTNFKVPGAGSLTAALAEVALTKVVKPSASDLDDDALRADDRQLWLFPEAELPLAPRDPAHQREVMAREDGHEFRCPCCAKEWSGDPRPPLRGKLAQTAPAWTKAKVHKLTEEEITKQQIRAQAPKLGKEAR